MSDIEIITHFEYACTPMFDKSFPIRGMVVHIIARNREEADELFHRHAHQFFDNDLNLVVTESRHGYRQVDRGGTGGIAPSGGRQFSFETLGSNQTGRDKERDMPYYENGQNEERINNNFKYHAPKNDQQARYEEIREGAKQLAKIINRNCPSSREQSVAFTQLEDTVMWANAAIARNE